MAPPAVVRGEWVGTPPPGEWVGAPGLERAQARALARAEINPSARGRATVFYLLNAGRSAVLSAVTVKGREVILAHGSKHKSQIIKSKKLNFQ